MRRTRRRRNVGSRTGARINPLGGFELVESFAIHLQSFRLTIRRVSPANVRPFVPIEAKPMQVFDSLRRRSALDAGRIDVFHSQNNPPAA
jgi:hypothetical protein